MRHCTLTDPNKINNICLSLSFQFFFRAFLVDYASNVRKTSSTYFFEIGRGSFFSNLPVQNATFLDHFCRKINILIRQKLPFTSEIVHIYSNKNKIKNLHFLRYFPTITNIIRNRSWENELFLCV